MGVLSVMRRTAAEWTLHKMVLGRDVIGVESDTGKSKIGDGATAWAALAYFTGEAAAGAAAFTDLTDVPDALVPYTAVLPNAAGTALECVPTGSLEDYAAPGVPAASVWGVNAYADAEYSDPSAGAFIGAQCEATDATTPIATMGASVTTATESAQIQFRAFIDGGSGVAEMLKGSTDIFRMVGDFEVTATDATARMTVGAVEYSIAKAVQVHIGGGTYFWPLFGPVA